jgi:hypothetical protein
MDHAVSRYVTSVDVFDEKKSEGLLCSSQYHVNIFSCVACLRE